MKPRWQSIRIGATCILLLLVINIHRLASSSIVGFESPYFRHIYFGTKKPPSTTPSTNPLYSLQPHSYAYVFYATQDDYACSALINIERLQRKFNTRHRIIILISTSVSEPMRQALAEHNATVVLHDVPPLAENGASYYRDVLLKLVAFKLHLIDPSLRRVLIMDADQLILKNLDDLFYLPDTDLAAPRAYWIQRDFISSTFMLISLSNRLWSRVREAMDTIQPDTYDMDLINTLFGDVVMMLPGNFVTINSHWEAWDIPSWYRDNDDESKRHNSSILSSHSKGSVPCFGGHDESGEVRELNRKLVHVYDQASVLHYFALGKPWSYTVEQAKEHRSCAHPLFYTQFGIWRASAQRICPGYYDKPV